jgi:hypothetical protein
MKTFVGYIREDTAPKNTEIYRALQATGKVGPNTGRGIRVSNPNKLSAADFIQLIKDTFDGVTDVVRHDPETGPNDSRMWPMFVFSWKGRVDCGVHLTGEIKGRGSKQTTEQEVSWLLILAAMYYNKDIINASEESKEHAVLNELLAENVYKRVYGANGKALDKAGARGLTQWLQSNPAWLTGHLSQCEKFVNLETNPPTRFVKDRSNIPIVKRAKEVFDTSVPDQKFDKDKWNPADVWLEYEDFVPDNFDNLDQLNKYLKTSIQLGNGIIGVSLKQGSNAPSPINMQGFIPNYVVSSLILEYGELLAQNVNTEYSGSELTGYSVMYRLFTAKTSETIRGEADKKGSLAMHGKVFLEYLDFLSGQKKTAAVEAVKGILVKQNKKKNNKYEFTKDGSKAFTKVKSAWAKLQSSDIFTYNSKGQKDTMDYIRVFNKRTPKREFLDYITRTGKAKRISEVSMQTRLSARFQTIVLGAVLAKLKTDDKNEFFKIVLGMLLYGKSESQWSAPHYKVE